MSIQLVIQLGPESSHTLEVPYHCTVQEIKHQISNIFNIPRDKFKLVNNGLSLADHLTIEQCQIKDFSRFIIMKSDSYMVNVQRAFHNDQFSVIVNPRDTIHAIKNKISKKESTPSNMIALTFRGVFLEDNQTAKECGIQENSVLVMYVEQGFF